MSSSCSFVTYRSPHGTSRTKRRSSDPNRQRLFDPCLGRITVLERVATDPLNGTYPSKHSWQQISHRQVFDLPISIGGADYRTIQKALKMSVRVSISISVSVPIEVIPAKIVRNR